VDKYKYGFETDIESDVAHQGPDRGNRPFHLRQEARAGVDARMASRRLSAAGRPSTEPNWAKVHYPKIDLQAISYYAAPKSVTGAEEPR
jgi:Fe-S cluster assembly protein SufB